MKKYNYIFVVALVGLLSLAGCSFLDSDNKSTVTADEQFATESGWSQLLNQAYFKMRAIYSSPLLFCAGTDMYTVSQGNSKTPIHTYSLNADQAEVQDLYENTYAAINAANCVLKYSSNETLNDEARFVRNYCYYILTQQFGAVPYLTEYIETASSSYPRTPLAEVYNGLITDLNDIIAAGRLSAEPVATEGRGRASILACKALLAKVYLAAGWDLQVKVTNDEKGLYQVEKTEYFEKAAALASEVAAAVPLTQSFADKWNFDINETGANVETLFAVQYDRATSSDQATGGHSQQHYFGGYMGSNTLGIKALKNDLCPTERVYFAYGIGDERFEGSFMTTIYGWDGDEASWSKQGYWGAYNADNVNALSVAWKFFPWYTDDATVNQYLADNAAHFVTTGQKSQTKVLRVADQVTCWAFTTDGLADATASANNTMAFSAAISKIGLVPPCKKFDDKNTPSTVGQSNGCYRDIVLLNASEIYLTGAEAYLMAGNEQKARELLNAVRTRAKAPALGSFADYKRFDYEADTEVQFGATDAQGITISAIDVILDERMRETLGEYYRWIDLRRTHQLVRYNVAYNDLTAANMIGNDGNFKLLRPIPTNELQINTGINEQNPGY